MPVVIQKRQGRNRDTCAVASLNQLRCLSRTRYERSGRVDRTHPRSRGDSSRTRDRTFAQDAWKFPRATTQTRKSAAAAAAGENSGKSAIFRRNSRNAGTSSKLGAAAIAVTIDTLARSGSDEPREPARVIRSICERTLASKHV